MVWTTRLISFEERDRFDAFVTKAPKGHILQSYAWGELKARMGWVPWRLVVEEAGQIVAAISVLERRLPLVGKALFYAPRGPVMDPEDYSILECIVAAIRRLARERQALLLKLDPDVPAGSTALEDNLIKLGFKPAHWQQGFAGVQPRYVFRLDISATEAELLAGMDSKTRYNIKLAQRREVQVTDQGGPAELDTFYRLLQITARRDHFLIRSQEYFSLLWDELAERGCARLFLAYYQGEPIAGTLLLLLGSKAWYLYGASSNHHRNLMPNYLLQWQMIRHAQSRGCTLYDFRGVPGNLQPDNPLYGLFRFKKGFGGIYTEFAGEFDLVFQPSSYLLWRMSERIYSNRVRPAMRWFRKLRGAGENNDASPAVD